MLGAKMHLLLPILLLGFVVMNSAQLQCDPLTQYAHVNGDCCKMCGPGTRMPSSNLCQDPRCEECLENEYQDKYTKAIKCDRQPYCDPNINFLVIEHKSKKERSTCLCQEGFHCSSAECITCVPHTTCTPGYGALLRGNHSQDTVCQKCPEGKFSNDSSWDGPCKQWTECESGDHIQKSGTDVSDNICEANRNHLIFIGVIVSFVLLAAIGVAFCIYKGQRDDARGKGCFQSCWGENRELLRETKVEMTQPTAEEELLSQPQEEGAGVPEENEDHPSYENASDALFSDNGNVVTQDIGISSKLSRQESQPHTLTGDPQQLNSDNI
ncbi:tumor necrosis factor receptor superfamily member 5 isoform X2 [Notothenia coriiceps]|uniref:Tumor necrosis factor receptor superfamily member 5 isoform X2 n=1 Tax=Notothenia coriiceps TaxID=8208 RepID=A0A6I9P0X6_9TELE|nr:PREDICTED: tumor necrosis factor receptor superfamily member 5-like isoform X2 [Notothenia coriiceps]